MRPSRAAEACRREQVDVLPWVDDYVTRRYGTSAAHQTRAAWRLLAKTVYNATDGHMDHAKGTDMLNSDYLLILFR